MDFTLSEQMWCLLWSVVCGVGLGVLYDVFRGIRFVLGNGKLSTFCCDVVFMLLCAFVTMFFSVAFSRGNPRYFILMGELTGFLIYILILGRVSVTAFGFLWRKLVKFIKIVTVYMAKTAKKLLQLIERILYNKLRKSPTVSEDSAEDH